MIKRRDALKDFLTPITSTEFSVENSPRPRHTPSGALQSMNDALTGISHEADELRKTLTNGLTIVEIDPLDIDASFIKDRLDDFEGEDFANLLDSIRENGQAVPVLVRPHPDQEGRYQLAYGHRRVEAIKQLGLKAKAFIRNLTDDELVIAQGNENLERKDLTFIEKAFFALRLEERGVKRSVIMATFGTRSKGVLSEMIALVRKLPDELVTAIGSAPGIGRPRWDAMAAMLDDGKGDWKPLIQKTDFQKLSSADRFERVIKELRSKPTKEERGAEGHPSWAPADKSVRVIARSRPKGVSLEITKTDAKPFADWITGNLDGLYEAFRQSKQEN